DDMDLELIEEGQIFLKVVRVALVLPQRRGGWFLEPKGPGANDRGLQGVHRVFLGDVLRDDDVPPVGKERQQQTGRPLAMDHYGIWIGRLNTLDDGRKDWPTGAHHAFGWVHDALNSVLHIRRRKRRAIVPLHPLMQMKRN